MTVDVLREVFHHAKKLGIKGVELGVLTALADAASPDGVCWLSIVPSSGRKADDPRCITHRASCSKRSAIRALHNLERRGAIEIRKAQRGRALINVYRVCLGSIADVEVEYDRLPFSLGRPFGLGAKLAPSQGGAKRGDQVPPTALTECHPRHRPGAIRDTDQVPSATPRARVSSAFGAEPPVDPPGEPSVEPPAAEQEIDRPSDLQYVGGDDRDPAAASSLDEVVSFVGQLAKADAGSIRQIEPYALALSRERFERAATKLLERRARGGVANDAGLFLHLLKVEFKELAREQGAQRAVHLAAIAEGETGGIERMKRDQPRRFLRLMLRPPVERNLPPIGDEYIERFLEDNVPDEDERAELREFARSLRDDVDAEAAA